MNCRSRSKFTEQDTYDATVLFFNMSGSDFDGQVGYASCTENVCLNIHMAKSEPRLSVSNIAPQWIQEMHIKLTNWCIHVNEVFVILSACVKVPEPLI